MNSKEIRQQFIDFFKGKKHTFVKSAPVIPIDDPTLLFTNAGMNQFKDIFLGTGTRDYKRAVNSQKCIRVSGKHNDLEVVGHDTYHHTFFEMLGNWSFGDYYKAEAIEWAWELLTEVWELPKDKLYATIYTTDDEAGDFWRTKTDIAHDHILLFGEKDNFWEMGNTGPCGPCSEIHIDLGPEFCDKKGQEHICGVNGECGRYIELWNLVFIQYNRDEQGELHPLPRKHVDTGAGFERLVSVLQKKRSNYDTDVFTPILSRITELCGKKAESEEDKAAFNVIADHVRMLTFSIADGGLPSNEGRGYVMRRILRRAARYGRKLNMHKPFIYKIVPTVVEVMGDIYPEIKEREEHIASVIRAEEESFNKTLDRGLEIFDKTVERLKNENKTIIPGSDIFKLYDTYGFPVDLTRILSDEAGLKLDESGFEKEMEAQRERARSSAKFEAGKIDDDAWTVLNTGKDSQFTGYTELKTETKIVRYYRNGAQVRLILEKTPFYAESGGQVGDSGVIKGQDFILSVSDTKKEGDHIVHFCESAEEFKPKTDTVTAEVKESARRETAKNHTATHLLHAALRQVLGDHIHQAGSLVDPERLRFDFTHFEKISAEDLRKIETLVNEKIQENIALQINEEKYTEAKKKGAMALFGEKYGDIVRTVDIQGFSFELCGGTHVKATGDIGLFIILSENGIASGVRRIEAVSGLSALRYLQITKSVVQEAGLLLNTNKEELSEKISELLNENKNLQKEMEKLTSAKLSGGLDDLIKTAKEIKGVKALTAKFKEVNVSQLKEMADSIREKSKMTAGLLAAENGDKLSLVCFLTDDLIKEKGLNAGNLVKESAKIAGGGGGGRPHLATAGAKDTSKTDAVFEKFYTLLNETL
jgi:alanyl-tRNA synthetase